MQNKIMSLLGLAMRGRNLVSGEFQTIDAIQNGKARLVLVAQDASENTKKLFANKAKFYGVAAYEFGTKEELGKAIGKAYRSSLAVCEKGLADTIMRQLEDR